MPDDTQAKIAAARKAGVSDADILSYMRKNGIPISQGAESQPPAPPQGSWLSSVADTARKGWNWATKPQQEGPDPYAVAKLGYSPTGPQGRQVSPLRAAGETAANAVPFIPATGGPSLAGRIAVGGLTRGAGAVGGYEMGSRFGTPGKVIGAATGALLPEAVRYSGLGGLLGRIAGRMGPQMAGAGEAAAETAGSAANTPGITTVPEPRPLFPGENPNNMASVPREQLPALAQQGKPGAVEQLQQLGERPVIRPRGSDIPTKPPLQGTLEERIRGSAAPPTPATEEDFLERMRRRAPGENPAVKSIRRKMGGDTAQMAEQDEAIRRRSGGGNFSLSDARQTEPGLLQRDIIDSKGNITGKINYEIQGNKLHVNGIGAPSGNPSLSNALGPKAISDLRESLARAHPEVSEITGVRVGGARGPDKLTKRISVNQPERGKEQ